MRSEISFRHDVGLMLLSTVSDRMSPGMKVTSPKDDVECFERMSRALYTAGPKCSVMEKKRMSKNPD